MAEGVAEEPAPKGRMGQKMVRRRGVCEWRRARFRPVEARAAARKVTTHPTLPEFSLTGLFFNDRAESQPRRRSTAATIAKARINLPLSDNSSDSGINARSSALSGSA
ncbi:hypothetical protein GCM10023165_20110 [Variovorax defluvii]|uniref:Uncharacterized protein n=1 Tax=Variovorax defluvii TaxID=913761 RepID=A0ABP8HJN9_9BURK